MGGGGGKVEGGGGEVSGGKNKERGKVYTCKSAF